MPRKEIDKLTEWVKAYGAKGLAWTKINEDGSCSSSYEKFLSEEEVAAVRPGLRGPAGGSIVCGGQRRAPGGV